MTAMSFVNQNQKLNTSQKQINKILKLHIQFFVNSGLIKLLSRLRYSILLVMEVAWLVPLPCLLSGEPVSLRWALFHQNEILSTNPSQIVTCTNLNSV